VAAGSSLVQDITLAGAATITPPAVAVAGAFLTYFITQPATPYAVTWGSITGSTFKHPPALPQTANMISAIVFVGRADGNWWSYPVLGVHP